MDGRRSKKEGDANSKFQSTDEAFIKYAESHPEDENLKEPNFHNYYSPSKDQKNGEMLFTVLLVTGLSYGISKLV